MAVLLVGVPATGQPVSSETDDLPQEDDRSWVTRTMHRYFGNSHQNDIGTEGKAVEIVDKYLQYNGLPIEVVIVYQVQNFKDGWDDGKGYSTRTLTSITNPLRSYTHDWVIRNYLTFKQGDKLDPFDLADSERMLRDLEFISDARISLIRLAGEIESVAVIVEVKDRWPFGVNATVVTAEKFSFDLYSSNVAGMGIEFSNRVLYSAEGDPSWGYHGSLRKDNIRGSFLDAELVFEDSYQRLNRKFLLERRLIYPGLNYLGGFLFNQVTERDLAESYEKTTAKYELTDFWIGRNFRLYDPHSPVTTARAVIVPAVTVYRKIYTDRPAVTQEKGRKYHNRQAVLVGLAYKRLKSYKTSYLFKDGEVEDYPSGYVLKGSAGYEVREYEKRTALAMESMAISIRNRGDIFFARLDIGGYLRDRKMEEGAFLVGGGYFSHLFGEEQFHYRFYTRLLYTLGLGRYPSDRIYLDSNTGIRGLQMGMVSGNQRLVGTFEYRLFTPVSILGFRLSLQFFSDVGMVGGEVDPIFKKKLYTSTGIGFRLRNPDLVLPTVQLRFSLLSNIEESGVAFGVKIGNVGNIDLELPGVKPSTLSYE